MTDVDESELDTRVAEAVRALRAAGARFAYVFGSRARGDATRASDVDVAAWFGTPRPPARFEVDLPDDIDLLVLDTAPLELRGRVALEGRLLFADDGAARVDWEAMTRKIYLDERPRLERAHNEFLESLRRG